MAIGVLNPGDVTHSTNTRPLDVLNAVNQRRWFSNDLNTELRDQDLNAILGQLRHVIDYYGITDVEGDDTLLRQAIATGASSLTGNVAALQAQVGAADKVPFFTAPSTMSTFTATSFSRTLLARTSLSQWQTDLGIGVGSAPNVIAFAALGSGADQLPYFTGLNTMAQTTMTGAARTLLDDIDVATMRTTLGLGTGATATIALYALLSGANFTGAVTVAADPALALGVATKQYVDLRAFASNAALTGVPTAPTAAPGTNTTQIASTAFVTAAVGVGGWASLASPVFTGTPSAPTAAPGTNTTQLATTQFVATSFAPIASPSFSGVPLSITPAPGDSSTKIATTAFVIGALTTSYAPLASPIFTGSPTAPTAIAGTATTQLATTAFVATSFAPLANPTFSGIPAAPTAAPGVSTTQLATTAFVTTADNLKANISNPAFTGVPTAPTATLGTNTTQLATTQYVVQGFAPLASPSLTGVPLTTTAAPGTNTTQIASTAFVAAATAAVTTSVGTTYAPLASPALTGVPTAPTAATATNTTQIATTAFVEAATTGATLLSDILAVDGVGSLLDSDLLDGQHGAYYQSLANATGVLADARLVGAYGAGITTLSITGGFTTTAAATNSIVVTSTGGGANVQIDAGTAGSNKPSNLLWSRANSFRWMLQRLGDAEAGGASRTGSDLKLFWWSDDNTVSGDIFLIRRSTGVVEFTNSPTAPTPAAADSTTKLATTAFVATNFAAKTAPTINEGMIINSPANDATIFLQGATTTGIALSKGSVFVTGWRWFIMRDNTAESGANVGSNFTITPFSDVGGAIGTGLPSILIRRSTAVVEFGYSPTAPTPTPGTNNTQLATTAFVTAAAAASLTGYALLASPAFTGVPTAPTAAPGTSTTQIATTAYVQGIVVGGGYAPINNPVLTGIATAPQFLAAGGTITTNKPGYDITQTWNNAATAFTAIHANVTATAYKNTSMLMDLYVGGVEQFGVSYQGVLYAGPAFIFYIPNGDVLMMESGTMGYITVAGIGLWYLYSLATTNTAVLQVGSNLGIGWSAVPDVGTGPIDTILFRDAPGTLALRRLANPQVMRIYNTTDATNTNTERLSIGYAANIAKITHEATGTGLPSRTLQLFAGANGVLQLGANAGLQWQIPATGHFLPLTNNAFDVGSNTFYARNLYAGVVNVPGTYSTSKITMGNAGDAIIQYNDGWLSLYTTTAYGMAFVLYKKNMYGTANSEYLLVSANGTDGGLNMAADGAGVFRSFYIQNWKFGPVYPANIGHLTVLTDNTHDIGDAAKTGRPRTLYIGTSVNIASAALTASTPMFDLSQTWNNAATSFTAIKSNITITAASAASYLLDLQVGAVSKFWIDRGGYIYSQGFYLGMTSGGSGTMMVYDATDGYIYGYSTTSLAKWQIGSEGAPNTAAFYAASDAGYGWNSTNTLDTGVVDTLLLRSAPGIVRLDGGFVLATGTITANKPAIDITQTWNLAGTTFTPVRVNITNTASSASSKLIDLQVGGVSKFSVSPSGIAFAAGFTAGTSPTTPVVATDGTSLYGLTTGLAMKWKADANGGANTAAYQLASDMGFGWNAGADLFTLSIDTTLYRDLAADTIAQRRLANAQTFRLYGTTDATNTNYERLAFAANATRWSISGQKGGTGTDRALRIANETATGLLEFATNNTVRWWITAAGALVATDNTMDIGASGATRPKNIFIASGLNVGATASVGTASTPIDARLTLAAGTTTISSQRILAGVAPTAPVDGDIWFTGTLLQMRVGGVTKTVTLT